MPTRPALYLIPLSLILTAAAPPAVPAEKAAPKPPVKKAPLPDPPKGSGVSITLKNGNEMKGAFLGRHDGAVWVGLDGGEIGLDQSTILKMTPEESNDAEYLQRRDQIKPGDVNAWWALCQWAHNKGLGASAKSAAETVLQLYPDHPQARAYLGYEMINHVWFDADSAKRAHGWKLEDGVWISPDEQRESAELAAKRAGERARAGSMMAAPKKAWRGDAEPEQGVKIKSYTERKW